MPIHLRALLLALVAARTGLAGLRVLADPHRFWNVEESYNATAAYHFAHGLWPEALTLQYRSFCGGCTVVATAAAPVLAFTERFVAWKGVALAWAAATMLVGFVALDRLAGRPAAWAFAVLMVLPPPGTGDLAGMLWGNHQETALLGLVAMVCLARGHGFATGLVLGAAVWFSRTALYEAVVLVPAALWMLPAQRDRVGVGLLVGLAPLMLPAAGGDAGYYRMDEAAGSAGDWLERAETLFAPEPLARRLYHPLRGMGWAAAATLAAAAVATLSILRTPRLRIFPALALAYAALYCVTRFPIFVVTSRAPLNNLRYHAPWEFVLTLLVAVGAGHAWERGRRWLAVGLVAAPLAGSVWARAQLPVRPDHLEALALRVPDHARFALVATPRLPVAVLREGGDDTTRGLLRHLYGLRLGDEVKRGERDQEETLAEVLAATPRDAALEGFGQGLAEACADAGEWDAWLDGLDPGVAIALARGAAITMGLCPGRDLESLRGTRLTAAAGGAVLDACGGPGQRELAGLGVCLAGAVEGVAEADAVLYGAGLRFGHPMRGAREIAVVAEALGPRGEAFVAGTRDPMVGMHVEYSSVRPVRGGP